ncbi:MAG: DUF4266 domain-containing protein [Proteobacteria bacterium]|nr:DUF4266 domain-containing protein [Pseudomonadota bacterium]MCP4916143.1 DUF4266 domain-containing protein [Pseudomonadota bacterium]
MKSFLASLVLVTLGACVTVRPYERELLADPVMQAEHIEDCLAQEQHFLATREASAGGYAIAGGGCGCN